MVLFTFKDVDFCAKPACVADGRRVDLDVTARAENIEEFSGAFTLLEFTDFLHGPAFDLLVYPDERDDLAVTIKAEERLVAEKKKFQVSQRCQSLSNCI